LFILAQSRWWNIDVSLFVQTCAKIARNPGVSTLRGLARHSIWHLVRRFHPLPMQVRLTSRSSLFLSQRRELNGCVALAWSQGTYDYNNMSFMLELTRQGIARVCMDVGANIGPYALLMSEQADTEVFCFEPHPGTFAVLNRVLQSNGRSHVRAFNVALSDAPGKLQFTDATCNPGNHVLSGSDAQPSISVQAVTGLDFCREQGVVPDLLKIDTEGHELEVLRGFGNLLSQVKVVLLEENTSPETLSACLPPDTFDAVRKAFPPPEVPYSRPFVVCVSFGQRRLSTS
jgi:FkbM family methyltransferase